MKLFIKKLILWPRDPNFRPREIEFSSDKINVLTGASGTGKSTITSIIDYCLGSGKCAIPVGMIRKKCAWYGVLLQLEHEQMLVARQDPNDKIENGKMYIEEGVTVSTPPFIRDKDANVNVELFKDKMDVLAGIPVIKEAEKTSEFTRPVYPAFRDMAAFNFQPQHIVANPHTMFFKTDTIEHREKLRTIFPFVLGSVTPKMLVQQKELKEQENELRRLEMRLREMKEASDKWMSEIESYYIVARRYGLLPNGSDDRTGWIPEQYVLELRSVKGYLKQNRIPDIEPGAGESFVQELQRVKSEEENLRREIGDLTRRLSKMQDLGSAFHDYQVSMFDKSDRLASVGWLRSKIQDEYCCPVCAARHVDGNDNLRKLLQVVDEFSEITRQVRVAPSKLDGEIAEVKRMLRKKEEELKGVHEKYKVLDEQDRVQARRQQEIKEIYLFAGRLEQALESFAPSGRKEDLQREVGRKRAEVQALRAAVDQGVIARRLRSAAESVSRGIGEIAQDLRLEHSSENVQLDVKELTVKFANPNGRTDYLWEVGSGQNWVGYHLATLLAMHGYLLGLETNPVPSFLVLDQPSQVYFPETAWSSLDEQPTKSSGESLSEDIKGVQRIFNLLKKFMNEHPGQFQVIVTEHAGAITWKEAQDSVNLVGNWRNKETDYLIPEAWLVGERN